MSAEPPGSHDEGSHSEARRDPLEAARLALRTDLEREIKRTRRKTQNIESDLRAAATRDELRAHAELIVANLYHLKTAPPGSVIEVLDYRKEPAEPLRFKLQPEQTAQQKSESLFKRAKKLERTERIAKERLETVQARLARLQSVHEHIDNARSATELEHLRSTFQVPRRQPPPQKRQQEQDERAPYRSFHSGELEIRVGRGAKDNDALTLHHSKPYDLWLHVRGTPGSHVILRLRRRRQPPPEALLDAATLAVHFSNARQKHAAYKSPVEVQYTERRFVRKVRHAPPGQVLVQREKVILLEVEPARLKRLLDSEKK